MTKLCHCCNGSGEENDNVKTSARLVALRKASHLTQQLVAQEMEMSAPYLCLLEKGMRTWRPSQITAYEVAVMRLRKPERDIFKNSKNY